MDISEYFSFEFLLVIASVIFILLLPKILITIAKKSKTGFIISLVTVGIIITSLVVFFTYTYNYKYSLNGKSYVYGRVTNIRENNSFTINSTKGTYTAGSIGFIDVNVSKKTRIYGKNMFQNVGEIKVGDFVLVVCGDEKIEDSRVHAVRVIRQ